MDKSSTTQVNDLDIQKGSAENLEDTALSPKEQRRIIWSVDRRLIIMLGFLHTVALIDRGNLGAAAVTGLKEELHLVGTQYSTIAVAFFPPYICLQIFGPLLVRRIGPVYYLSGVCFIWGAVMLSAGFVKKWSEMLGIRIIIGALEAGFFPASVYLIATWYTRFEIQKRFSIFYLLGCVASATTGILSYGITFMNGLAGLTAWRWIFVIQGLLTCVLAFISYFVLIDFPDKMKTSRRSFLSDAEYDFIIDRINRDRADVTVEPFSMRKYLSASLDLHIWGFGFVYYCTTTTAYAIAYFMPLIFREGMGFSQGASLCLFAPPYAAAGIVMFATSWVADKYRVRGPIILFNATLTLIGLPLMGFATSNAARLVGCFFTTMGANSNVPAAMAYQANNVRGQWKRAICSAVFVGLGASGGMTGSLVFRSQDAPGYRPGISTCIGLTGFIIVLVGLLSLRMHLRNRKADRGELVIEGLEDFRYTL
ncbi:MFS general substrate transporter [Aspergillus bertholletiae]|uniref:MFS general substrate transporter n=1 Tax=Aspergillus bertholletiae TaxID=1226010 RepID=A0A5N7BEN1_9EURO|nr:MFS general substrate transporter [Aspergillus bertholletiae]